MPLADGRYTIVAAQSTVEVIADAPGHKFRCAGNGVSGELTVLGGQLTAAEARFPLAALDAGAFLSNRELRKFLGSDQPRFAHGSLEAPVPIQVDGERVTGEARLLIRCDGAPGAPAPIRVRFSGTGATATLELDASFTALGYKPPRLLIIKVADPLRATITLLLNARVG